MNSGDFHPNWFSKPGDTLSNLLSRKSVTLDAFAKDTDWGVDRVRGLLEGSIKIDDSIAAKLAHHLGGTKQFWLNRQASYDKALNRAVDSVPVAERDLWLKQFPQSDIASYGWVNKSVNRKEALKAYLSYFSVNGPSEWHSRYATIFEDFAFRTSPSMQSKIGPLSAWLRRGEIEADLLQCKPLSISTLKSNVDDMRKLTKVKNPTYFLPRLRNLCADAGVAVVFVRAPSGCRASGATRYLSSDKAMIILSFRHLSDDQFWFTFFHELGHVILHSPSQTFVDDGMEGKSEQEIEANAFAADILVPRERREELSDLKPGSQSVIRFATSIGIAPGIVVGQLQHSGIIRRNQLNFLKRYHRWDAIASAVN
ncbi:ImmA/IrrE family metallo-endopeptidase [Afipia broomeae]|uniref:IrrE N-terminal-like domain-containing protein n=1 Tax=Afipia broomeae ATCC 49717 TaxID=883078 RepID=K8PNB5_9BRAD|nr:ImmA/IrrE family metallo-endopeptidase [Afipia broomeae]EKS39843.1 hypothetical protein HMPREF9695_01804 [Afipia broomeae ATCC 49717]